MFANLLAGLILVAVPAASPAQSSPQAAIEAWTDKLLSQIGGRDVWARARGFHMFEIMKSARYPQPAFREYWVDFERPRIMEKTLTGGVNQIQALDENSGWRLRNGKVEGWDETTTRNWSFFWTGIPTRIFHQIAKRDPSVELRAIRPDRMDVFVNGRLAVWIATDPEGRPIAYGREDNHRETHFLGQLRQYGSVRLWDTATEPGGQWSDEMVEYYLLDQPHTVSFAPPTNGRTDPDPMS